MGKDPKYDNKQYDDNSDEEVIYYIEDDNDDTDDGDMIYYEENNEEDVEKNVKLSKKSKILIFQALLSLYYL